MKREVSTTRIVVSNLIALTIWCVTDEWWLARPSARRIVGIMIGLFIVNVGLLMSKKKTSI